MGLFKGIGNALKGIDWGNVMSGLQSAGAIAQGDYGTAAQIQQLRQRERGDRAEAQAKAAMAEQQVAALMRQGISEPDARAIVQSGAADTVLAGRFGQQNDSEFTRTMKAAGIDPNSERGRALYAQRAATMASPAPQMIGSPETGYRWVQPPAQGMPQQAAQPPQGGPQIGAVVNGYRFKGGNPNDQNSWEPVSGGGASNGAGNFPGFRFP